MPTPHDIATRAAPNAGLERRDPKLAIALSGGGYRAMLFHLGALRRLNEFGLLSVMDRLSTVSGGSVAGAVLGLRWPEITFDRGGVGSGFETVERDVLAIADRTIDVRCGLVGLLPWTTGAREVARSLRRAFGVTRLGDLSHEQPRFTFNTTNMQTGTLFRWAPRYGADYQVGMVENPTISLAEVVAASAAFPPWLSPLKIRVPGILVDANSKVPVVNPPGRLWLTDGGVYDNLGVETLKSFHTVLASDGGAPFGGSARLRTNLLSQALRTAFILNADSGRQRRRALVNEFTTGQRLGTLWTINTPIGLYPAPNCLPCPDQSVRELALVRTRLQRVPDELKHRLVNWGYASADAAVRSYVEPSLPAPSAFPYPGGVG